MEITKHIEQFRKDLELKNYSQSSIGNYVSQVKLFLWQHNGKFTDASRINETAIKDWLLESKSVNGRKHKLSALKLFYRLTINQQMKLKYIEYPRSERKLPIVLSQEEIQKMFDVCENTKHKVILALLYSVGLRISELINLKWGHIDRSRMIINIIRGKGNKDRQVMLSANLIPLLEMYYKEYHSVVYVLNGQGDLAQYSKRSVAEVLKQLATKAGIDKRMYPHLIRHCTGTHLVENGTDVKLIQKLFGHNSSRTTDLYTHISHNIISRINSPLNSIKLY